MVVALSIGAVRFCLQVEDPRVALGERYAPFVDGAGASPDIALRVLCGVRPEEEGGPLLFDSGGTWALYRRGEGFLYVFRTAEPEGSWRPFNLIQVNGALSQGVIYALSPARDAPGRFYPFEFPMSEVLTVHLLAQGRGVLLHAVGLKDDGRGELFCGASGAGKSTTAHLWSGEPGVEILSDDRTIIRKQGDAFWMYGTPWHGEAAFASPGAAPLRRLFFLNKGTAHSVRPLSRKEAVARLLTCCFPTFWDPMGMAFTMAFLEEMAAHLPCYELTFAKERSVVDFVRGL